MRYALVTGSTQGIGKSIGIELLKRGYYVYFNYFSNEEAKEDLIRTLNVLKLKNYSIIKADLSCKEGYKELYKNIQSIVDVIVFNVAITDRTSFGKITYDNILKVFNTNVFFPFMFLQTIANKINNEGRIIFISAILGEYPHARSLSYGISKATVNSVVKNLVKVFAQRKITVNAIAPSFIEGSWHNEKKLDHIERIKNKIALKRFGTPEEVASLCMEIVKNQYINGAILDLSGGYDYE